MSGNKITVEITIKDDQVEAYRLAAKLAEEIELLKKEQICITGATIKVHTWTGNEPVTR